MNDLFTVFVNWQTGLVCLGVFLFTFIIRRVVETIWLSASKNRFWQGIFLPLGAIGTGMIIGICSQQFPWPMPIATNWLARAMYGGICGLASGWVYTHFRKFVKEFGGKAGTPATANDSTVPADPEPPPSAKS